MGTFGTMLKNPYAKSQSAPKLTQTDPFSGYRPQQRQAESILLGNLGGGGGDFGNPYEPPSARETGALDAMMNFSNQARPLYSGSVKLLDDTASGAYLDPTKTQAYQDYAGAQKELAADQIGQARGQIGGRLATRGNFNSSARVAQEAGAAGEIGGGAAQRVGHAGFGMYGQERGYQDQAAQQAMGLAPSIAGQIFGNEESMRATQQRANTAQLRGQLEQLGLRGQAQDTVLRYLGAITGDPQRYVVGPSVMDQVSTGINRWAGSKFGDQGSTINPSTSMGYGYGGAASGGDGDYWTGRGLT